MILLETSVVMFQQHRGNIGYIISFYSIDNMLLSILTFYSIILSCYVVRILSRPHMLPHFILKKKGGIPCKDYDDIS